MHDEVGDRSVVRAAYDPGLVMQRIVEQAVAAVPRAEGAAIELLVDGQLRYVCAAGSLAEHVGTRLDLSSSLSGLAVRSGTTEWCDDSELDPRVDRDACRRVGSTSMVCVPLRRRDEPVGVLKVSSTRPHAFGTPDVTVLARLARFVTTSITNARELAEAAEDLFTVDAPGSGAWIDDQTMSTFVANVVDPGSAGDRECGERVASALRDHVVTAVLQPIVHLGSGRLAGAEALARFAVEPVRPPDAWFSEARRAGLGPELQLEAIRCALDASSVLPSDAFLALNVDADALACAELAELLDLVAPRPVVLELTEHVEIDDYPELRRVVGSLRDRGARIAIDDTGAGYSSFAHIVKLAPDIIKLDIEIVRGVDADPVRRSLVTAVVTFARETGASVVAEGVETDSEVDAIRDLGVEYGQGYALARPMPPDALSGWIEARAPRRIRSRS